MMQNWLVGRITIPSYPDPCRFGYPIGRFQDVSCFDRFIIGQIPGNGAACRCAQGLMTDNTSENRSPSAPVGICAYGRAGKRSEKLRPSSTSASKIA